jgi:hypothetical protein
MVSTSGQAYMYVKFKHLKSNFSSSNERVDQSHGGRDAGLQIDAKISDGRDIFSDSVATSTSIPFSSQ